MQVIRLYDFSFGFTVVPLNILMERLCRVELASKDHIAKTEMKQGGLRVIGSCWFTEVGGANITKLPNKTESGCTGQSMRSEHVSLFPKVFHAEPGV